MTNKKEKLRLFLKNHLQESIEDFAEAIEFILKPFGLYQDNSTEKIPSWTVKNQPSEDYRNRQINNNIEQNITSKTNIVYEKETTIYEQNVFVTNNNYPNLPDKPSSLIPIKDGIENDNQTPTKVTIGAPITLGQSIASQSFGKMLFNPFTTEKRKIRQAGNTDVATKLVELNEKGLERFAGYLVEEEGTTALDAIALLMPVALRGLSGSINILFGKETLRYYFANLTASSVNALIGVYDTIPAGYEIEYYEPIYNQIEDSLTNIKLNGSGGIRLEGLDELFDTPVNWEAWLKEASTLQYGQDKQQNNPTVVNNFPDFLRHVLAPFYFRLGLANLPFELPKTLIEDPKEGEEEEKVIARQLSEYFLWMLTAFDSVIGQFPIKIRVEDTDLIKTGDQPLELTFPNLAETLAELTGLALANQTNNNALLEIGLRELAETGQGKQQAIQNYYLLAAIQEYLGFESKQISKEIDFLFNPGIVAETEEKQSLDKYLEPSKLKIPIESNTDKDTLEKHMLTLIEGARIIKSVHFRNIDLRNKPKNQIIDIIKQASQLINSLDFNGNEDLEEFFDSLEKGFTDKLTTNNTTKPFNRNYSERPRIRQNINNVNDNQS